MSKPTCKAEIHPYSVINKEVRHLSPFEMQVTGNDATYAKRTASRARRHAAKISKHEGWSQWMDMVNLSKEMMGWRAFICSGCGYSVSGVKT